MEALLVLGALACPVGMLAMMGGMMWMSRRSGSEEIDDAAADPREVTHA